MDLLKNLGVSLGAVKFLGLTFAEDKVVTAGVVDVLQKIINQLKKFQVNYYLAKDYFKYNINCCV